MDDRAFNVRTIYSQKKHGSQVPQTLKSERILVQPRSGNYSSRSDYRRNDDSSRDYRLNSVNGKSNQSNFGGQQRRHYGHGTNRFAGSQNDQMPTADADSGCRTSGQGSNPFSAKHDEATANAGARQRIAHGQGSRPYSALCDESMTGQFRHAFNGAPATTYESSKQHHHGHGLESWNPTQPRCSTAPVTGNVVKKRPEVPPRLSQLRSNVYASDSNSGDFGTSTRKKSPFVPIIPELSPNSFSRAWQKAEEERKLQNELGDGQRRRDWSQVDFLDHEPQNKPEQLNAEQEPIQAPKVPKRQRLPTPNHSEPTPEPDFPQQEPTPEPDIPELDFSIGSRSPERSNVSTPIPELVPNGDSTESSLSESGSSTSTPEVVPNQDTTESSLSVSPSSSEESLLGAKDREKILELFTIEDLKSDDADRFQEASNASKMFYSILNQNGVVKYQTNLRQIQSSLETFALTPVAVGFKVTCRITRDKKGVDRNVFPNYYLYLEMGDGRRTIILTARKRKKSATSNYLISVDPTDLTRCGESYIGKVRSNLMGTQFTIYDNGNSPKHYRTTNNQLITNNSWTNREELGTIIYETNVLGLKGPRKLRLLIPSMKNEYQRLEIRPGGFHDSIAERLKRDELRGISDLRNKTPIWNHSNQSYCLNFSGRVSRASVKNFQIVHDENQKYIILQFGRTDEDQFSLDFGYPLCPLQAFAIALSSFDTKIACE